MSRVNATQRIEMQIVAEREIQRYAGDHALWHKYVHNVELDSMQILKCIEMDEHPSTIDYSCRRTGKTAIKELYELKHNATNADQELGIVAPREAQSLVNLRYHLDAINRSEILNAYIDYKRGRRQLADTYYVFANRSKTQAYGIMANVDGGDLTSASLEEVDDMPKDRLYSRFLLMMGSTRRLGASKESKNTPTIRITGVFKGADTLTDMIKSGKYHTLSTVDAYLGIELGILNEKFIMDMRDQLSPDEYIRQLLCRNVSARNLIWELWIRRAMQIGLMAKIETEQPLPGVKYKKRGLVSFGYDHSGHGENPEASRYALVVTEQIGNYCCFIFAKTWPPGTDETIVKNDLKGFWRYFMPEYAMGDAYGIGLITQLNHELFAEGLISVSPSAIEDGHSTASTWAEWAFSPLRFEGMQKHVMAQVLRSLFNNSQAAIPYIDDLELSNPDTDDLRLLIRQLGNIKSEKTSKSYSAYKQVNTKTGDDLFDAAMAAVWALASRGASPVQTVIETIKRSRAQMLGSAA